MSRVTASRYFSRMAHQSEARWADIGEASVVSWQERERSLFQKLRRAQDEVYAALDRVRDRGWTDEIRTSVAYARGRVTRRFNEYMSHLRSPS